MYFAHAAALLFSWSGHAGRALAKAVKFRAFCQAERKLVPPERRGAKILVTEPGRIAMGSSRGVDAVERALSVLACFEVAGETLTLAQVAQRSRLYKSTILRLAFSLQRTGFLKRDENGRFSLGDKLRQLSDIARVSEELGEQSLRK